MPTAQSLIDDALKELNILDAGDSPSAAQSADCLTRLNAQIDSWNQDENMATSATIVAVTTIANTQSYALGTRYSKVAAGSHIMPSGGPTMPLKVVNAKEWNEIPDRDISGNWVRFLFYDRGFSTGTLYCSPKPIGVGTLSIIVWAAQSQFSTLATNNTLLPGWQRALTATLALEIAPLFSRKADDLVLLVKSQADAVATLKQLNSSLMGDMAAAPAGG